MVETDPIQIDKIQRKLRHRYMLLVGLNIIAYLTVIAFCIVGCNKIGGYSGNSYAFDEYWLYGGLAGLPGIFALLAFAITFPPISTIYKSGCKIYYALENARKSSIFFYS